MKLGHFTHMFLSEVFGINVYEIQEFFEILERHQLPYADIQAIIQTAKSYGGFGEESTTVLVEALMETAGLVHDMVEEHDGFLPRVTLTAYYWQLFKPWDNLHRAAEEFFIVEPGYLDDGLGHEIEVTPLLVALPEGEWLTVGGYKFPLFREYNGTLLVLPGGKSNLKPTKQFWEWLKDNLEPEVVGTLEQLPSLVDESRERMTERLKQALVEIL
jgi:hypothetical protein